MLQLNVSFIALAICVSADGSDSRVAIDEVLSQAELGAEWPQRFTATFTSLIKYHDSANPDNALEAKIVDQVYTDGLRWHITSSTYSGSQPDRTVSGPNSRRQLSWDGSLCLDYRYPSNYVVAESNDSPITNFLHFGDYGAGLNGWFRGDKLAIWDILRAAPRGSLWMIPDTVNGDPCVRILCRTEGKDDYSVWLDPNRGFQIRRAIVLKHNLNVESAAGERSVRFEYELDNVQLEKIGTRWFPISATVTHRTFYGENTIQTQQVAYSRADIDLSPSFDSSDLLSPSIPNGTPVIPRDGENIGLIYEIVNGYLAVRVDSSLLESVAVELAAAKIHLDTDRNAIGSVAGEQSLVEPEGTAASIPEKLPLQTSELMQSVDSASVDESIRRSYCGLHCVYGSLLWFGKTIDFLDLCQPRYIGSSQGSSIEEVQAALEDLGLRSLARKGVAFDSLAKRSDIAILHVKSNEYVEKPDHFILYLGTDDGTALILDPGKKIRRIPFHQLAAIWDGTAIFVSESPITDNAVSRLTRSTVARWSLFLALSIAGTAVVIQLLNRRCSVGTRLRPAVRWTTEITVLAMITIMCGVFYHRNSPNGLLKQPDAARYLYRHYYKLNLPEVAVESLADRMRNGALVVDVRRSDDFRGGTIPGAVNLPISASDEEIATVLSYITKDRDLVLFCYNEKCTYAETMARRLVDLGYSRCSILVSGWSAWVDWHREHRGPSLSS